MKRKNTFLLLIGVLLLMIFSICVVALLQGPRDPEFQGKRLSARIEEFDGWRWQSMPDVLQSLRHYGSSAEPLLKRMLRSRDSSLEAKFLLLLSKQSVIKIHVRPAAASQTKALDICCFLGARVKGTAPELEALANDVSKGRNLSISLYALNTLALMGPAGVRGLAHAMTNQTPVIRARAAELLGTAQGGGTDDVVALLSGCTNAADSALSLAASSSLELIRQRRMQALPGQATNWLESVNPSIKPPYSLWDISQRTQITGTSGLEQLVTWKAQDLFGDNSPTGEPGHVIFTDSHPDGFVHYIEWQVPSPVTVRAFGLIAGHDAATYGFQHALRSFKLYARRSDAEPFQLLYSEEVPVPYGEGLFSCFLFLFRNVENSFPARSFRAEFVQNGSGPWHGPRTYELYGFAAPLNRPMVMDAIQNQESYIRDTAAEIFQAKGGGR